MALYKSVYYYLFDAGTQFRGNEKKYAMQYKKFSIIIIIIVIIMV